MLFVVHQVCKVDVGGGDGKELQIVTNAKHVAEVTMHTPATKTSAMCPINSSDSKGRTSTL